VHRANLHKRADGRAWRADDLIDDAILAISCGDEIRWLDRSRKGCGAEGRHRFRHGAGRGRRLVSRGVFGARMQVALVNDGPVTILLEAEPL
jgi:D-Tyr-tRNA(Tyr) deacylase